MDLNCRQKFHFRHCEQLHGRWVSRESLKILLYTTCLTHMWHWGEAELHKPDNSDESYSLTKRNITIENSSGKPKPWRTSLSLINQFSKTCPKCWRVIKIIKIQLMKRFTQLLEIPTKAFFLKNMKTALGKLRKSQLNFLMVLKKIVSDKSQGKSARRSIEHNT